VSVDIGRARVAILGAGSVGTTFALAIVSPVYRPRFKGEVRLWSRSAKTLGRARADLWRAYDPDAPIHFERTLAGAIEGSDVVLLCVSDDALEDVARKARRAMPAKQRRRPVVLFASGYHDRARIGAGLAGFQVGRLHPLWPVLLPPPPRPFFQVPFGIEGNGRALVMARAFVDRWRGLALRLDGKHGTSASYHAGAALLGGGIVSLYSLAEQTLARAVGTRDSVRDALCRFACANVINAWLMGTSEALTGPVARGAEAIVRGHLRALRRVTNGEATYRVLGRTMLELARARGSFDASTGRRLARLLGAPRRKG
jgi:hypothetical protein